MGAASAIVYLVAYGAPLLLTAGVAFGLRFVLFRRKSWGWPAAIAIAVALSCVQAALSQMQLRGALAQLDALDTRPDTLALAPGALLHLQEQNHAGVTCPWECPLAELPWVTDYVQGDARQAMVAGEDGTDLLAQADLWNVLAEMGDGTPLLRDGDFPYRYLFISVPGYVLQKAHDAGDYRPDDWPETVKGAHALFEIPADGLIDFRQAKPLFRRFNLQDDVLQPLFWGGVNKTTQTPTVLEIVADLNVRVMAP